LTELARIPQVVDPRTGEIIDLTLAPNRLAGFTHDLEQHKRLVVDTLKIVEDELRRQMGDRTLWPVGDWEITLEAANESVWDAEELEGVLRDLVDRGEVNAGSLTGIIRHETVVSRTEAGRLVKQLTGPARMAVERCRTWQRKRGRLRVVPSAGLPEIKP
jgi:hypothetical protein